MTETFLVIWSGGYEVPEITAWVSLDKAQTKAREALAEASEEYDDIRVLRVVADGTTRTVEEIEVLGRLAD